MTSYLRPPPTPNTSTSPIPLPQRPGFPHRGSVSTSFSNSPFARNLRLGSFSNGFPLGSYEEKMHRTGSWKGKFVGSEVGFPWQSGGIDAHDFSMPMSTSIESTGGLMKMDKREADYCQNYNCCGLELSGMHDLLEHYEDCHVIILPSPSTPHGDLLDIDSMEFDEPLSSGSSSSGSSFSASSTTSPSLEDASPPLKKRTPIPASAPLQLSDVLASAGNSAFEISILSPFPSSSAHSVSSSSSSTPSAAFSSSSASSSLNEKKTKQALAARAAFINGGRGGLPKNEQWNYLSEDKPLGQSNIFWEGEYKFPPPSSTTQEGKEGLDTTLLFSSLPPPDKTPSLAPGLGTRSSQKATPYSHSSSAQGKGTKSSSGAGKTVENTAAPSALLSIPPPPPSANQKLYHCPTPGCNKSYKQQNGLKYHLKVGQCDFNVRDGVENGLSEEQAEEKSRPYQCQVGGGCWKRYRQMNGLRYHYLNSGVHGAIGLALIQQGKHVNPKGGTLPSSMGVNPTPISKPADSNAVPGFTSLASLNTLGGENTIPRPGNWPLNQLSPRLQQQILQQGAHPKGEEMLWSVNEEADGEDDIEME